MTDPTRMAELLRDANPVPDERGVLLVARQTDPLWQTIRARIETGAGVAGVDVLHTAGTGGQEADMETSTRSRNHLEPDHRLGTRRSVAIAASVALVVLALALGTRMIGTGDPRPVGDPGDGEVQEDGAGIEPAQPGDNVSLRFTFTGEDGPEGCRYDGPEHFVAGKYASELANESDTRLVNVNIDPLRPEATYETFLEWLGAEEGNYPVIPPLGSRSSYLDGDHRTVHDTAWPAAGAVQLLPGRFVVYCWIHNAVWPAGAIEVLPAE